MDFNQLALSVNELVSAMSVNYSISLQDELNKVMFDFKSVEDLSELNNRIRQLIVIVGQFNNQSPSIDNHQLREKIIHLKQQHENFQQTLTTIEQETGHNLVNLKTQIRSLFDALLTIIDDQSTKIINLESKMVNLSSDNELIKKKIANLEKKSRMVEKVKLIGDLLNPLSQEIHSFLDQLNGNPHHYDDPSIYLAFKVKSMGDHLMENEYKHCFGKPIVDATYEEFYTWIVTKASTLNIEPYLMLRFLYEKKKRNFDLHSDMLDFFADCRTTYRCTFDDLLRKHDLNEFFETNESIALKTIFDTYYCNQIAQIQQLAQANASRSDS